jgi:MFS family permease
MLAVAHSSSWQIYTATFIMGIGIGLAFASMVNVIVESVSAEQTGVATGMNVIFRNIGGALGGQISASILTAAVAVGGFPTEDAFVDSFWLAAGMLMLGFVAALLVPRPKTAGVGEPEPAAAG